MATKTTDLYLYLARRDKAGIRILARLKSTNRLPTILDETGLISLQLSPSWYKEISQIIYESRMLWEPWIQSVTTFEDFRNSLKKRGYTNIPVSSQPEFIVSTVETQIVNVSRLPQNKTMLRKN